MSRTWKRPGDHGRGVGDWRGKGIEYEHNFRPTRHIGSFKDYYSGNYGYDDDMRFEHAIPRKRFGAVAASPNDDVRSHGRIMPAPSSHLRSRSGMRDKELRRDFERDSYYDDNDESFAPKSSLFYDEGEEERQPEDYIFYLIKCRGDKKKVFTHALAVDKKAKGDPEVISDYVNEQLNSNPNLTSKYGSSIKILKVTLYNDPNKWYKALEANGINPDDVIWAEDRSSGDVEEDIEETVDIEDEEFETQPGTFEDLEEGVSEYINGIIEYDDRDNTLIDTYEHIEKALNDRGYSYTKYCPCKDLVRCEDISDYRYFYKDFNKEAVEAIKLCMDMLPDVYDGITVDSITPQQEEELIDKIHDMIWDYLQLKFDNPSPAPQENYLRDKNPIRDDRSMEEKGYIDYLDYSNR